MIHLQSIELANFKGVSRLRCDFDDLTVLAGLNNYGKTTILQAVYLLFASLPKIVGHPHIEHQNSQSRVISLDSGLSSLGLRDTLWLSSILAQDVEGTITGRFTNSLRLDLGVVRNGSSNFVFTVSHEEVGESEQSLQELIAEASKLSAAILTPPGEVPSREEMVNGDQYQSLLRQGKGAQLWRNSIWWGIQSDGFESFAPVQKQISKYFPDVELLLPTLGDRGQPEILIKYREQTRGPLDIAQSGAGLRTFISLARILEQSPAQVILLDEPDAHLHASQQAVVLDLMFDAASRLQRQVIIASHSPEIISRVPSECLRWVERDSPKTHGGEELGHMLEQLGATTDIYLPQAGLPDVLVYVEGIKEDRPILEALIKWCRQKVAAPLPTTIVIPHRDGRFEGPTLQGIARFAKECTGGANVVGVRDLDWYYDELPSDTPHVSEGDGWSLITLPCKEMENLFCDPEILFQAYERQLTKESLRAFLDEESNAADLVDQWRYQVRPRIRDRLPKSDDPSTKEKAADESFAAWCNDPLVRCRLVAGKSLLRRVKQRIRRERGLTFYPVRMFEGLSCLPPSLLKIAKLIFPAAPLENPPQTGNA